MYLKRITLKNIKCFENVTIDFERGEGVRKWTTLFGRNGLGKSTILQAIGAVLAGPSALRELLPVATGWVRSGKQFGEIEAEILGQQGDSVPNKPRLRPYILKYLVAGSDPGSLPEEVLEKPSVPEFVAWSGGGNSKEKENLTKDRKLLIQTAYSESTKGWLACGYGPFRRLTGGAQAADEILWGGRRSSQFITLFREDAALTNATKWLIELYNTGRDGDDANQRTLAMIRKTIAEHLFPEPVALEVTAKSAMLRTGNGEPISFFDLSDGYRSMLALSIDMLRWILKAFPDTENPLLCTGVVVIDELDAHLHPSWQRLIGDWLREKFPDIQFIITTHSPFLAQVASIDADGKDVTPAAYESAESGNIRLRPTENGVIADISQEPAQMLLPDQILQSELFDMGSLYPPVVEKWLEEYEQLRRVKRAPDAPADPRIEQLSLFFESLPSIEKREVRDLAGKILSRFSEAADAVSKLE